MQQGLKYSLYPHTMQDGGHDVNEQDVSESYWCELLVTKARLVIGIYSL